MSHLPPAARTSECLFRLTTSTRTPSLKCVWWLPSISGWKYMGRVTPADCANWIVFDISVMAGLMSMASPGAIFSRRDITSSMSLTITMGYLNKKGGKLVGYIQTSERSSISSIVVRNRFFFVKRDRFCAGVDLGSWMVSITEARASNGTLFITSSTTNGLDQRMKTG